MADELERSDNLEVVGGRAFLSDVSLVGESTTNLESHCRILHGKTALRALLNVAHDIEKKVASAPGEVPDLIASIQDRLTQIRNGSRPSSEAEYVAVRMDRVERELIDWLWRPWIPLRKLSYLEGPPKAGKTTLGIQMVATVTRGYGFPTESGIPAPHVAPRNAVILCAEDGLGDTIGHRLDQAGADSSRVYAMTGVKATARAKEQMVTFADLEPLERLIVDVQPAIVLIDPIQAYIGANVDMYRANETRAVMGPLAVMAQKHGTALVIIRHFRKQSGSAIDRGMGSTDLGALARSIMMVVRDPDDPRSGTRILAHSAANLLPEAKSIQFHLTPDGFRWGRIDERSADDLLAEPKKGKEKKNTVENAAAWLKQLLSDGGSLTANEIKSLGNREGFSLHILQKAKMEAGIEDKQSGGLSWWQWPNAEAPPTPF